MNRKKINIILSDGKEYIFSERNREDVDFSRYHNKIREANLNLIQTTIKDKDNQLALMMAEMRRFYTGQEISIYITNNPQELKRLAFDSFKVANPSITFDQFDKICSDDDTRKVIALINELEEQGEKKKVAEPQ